MSINLREIDLTLCNGARLLHAVAHTVKKRWEQTKGSTVTDTDLYHGLSVQMPTEDHDSSFFLWARDYLEMEGPNPRIIVGASFAPDRNALTRAVKRLDRPMVEFLLAFTFHRCTSASIHRVLFQVKDKHMLTAAAEGELQLLDLLVEAKGNVDVTNEIGERPQLFAAQNRNAPLVERLWEQGATMEVIRKDGTDLVSITIINGDDNLLGRAKGLVGLWEQETSLTVKEWTRNLAAALLTPLWLERKLRIVDKCKHHPMKAELATIIGITSSVMSVLHPLGDTPQGLKAGLQELRTLLLYNQQFLQSPESWPTKVSGQTFCQLATQGKYNALLQWWEAARVRQEIIPTITSREGSA